MHVNQWWQILPSATAETICINQNGSYIIGHNSSIYMRINNALIKLRSSEAKVIDCALKPPGCYTY